MKHFINSCVCYSEGAVNVFMYDYNKVFSSGDQVKIRIKFWTSRMKLTKVSYYWNDSQKPTEVKVTFNGCRFRTIVPETPDNKPVLKVVTEVQFKGEKSKHVHTFRINDM